MNKIRFAAAAILLLGACGATAQDMPGYQNDRVQTRHFRFGVYVAPTIAYMKPTTDKTDDGKYLPRNAGSSVGFMYGLMGEYQFAENYAIVSGFQANMAKGHITTELAGSPTNGDVLQSDYTYKLNYVEVPIGLKLKTDPIGSVRFFGQLGLSLGFNIAKKADYRVQYQEDNVLKTIEGTNEKIKGTLSISPVMCTMNLGAGMEYPLSAKLNVYAGVFFNNGFAPDATNTRQYNKSFKDFRDGNTRLNNFALRVGLFF